MLLNIRQGEVPDLIKNTAQEIAGAFYDANRTERFRQQAGSQDDFVRRHWKNHIDHAVEALSMVLGQPGTPEDQKEAVYDAICEYRERSQRGTPQITTRRLM
jgi:hypothetical protein